MYLTTIDDTCRK